MLDSDQTTRAPRQTGRAGKRAPHLAAFSRRQTALQVALWCRCGSLSIAKRGLCQACYAREQHDRRYFAGRRAAVIARDGRLCRLCAVPCHRAASLIVHHRRPGRSHLPWLVSLCRACHARVHRLGIVRRLYPTSFLELWREQHPAAPEQLALCFAPGRDQAEPRSLFEGEP